MRTGSYLNAFFKGRQEREFAWFGLGATLPAISTDAQRAARQIVTALRRGESERILTLPAQLAARMHGAFPGLTHWLMEVANRMLASHEGGSRDVIPGKEAEQRLNSWLYRLVPGLGRSAAKEMLEV